MKWKNVAQRAASLSLLRLICNEGRRACLLQILLLYVLASHGLDLSDRGRAVETTLW